MKISVIGAGYVGLVTGVCMAKIGNEVTLVDINEKKLEAIKNKRPPIYEEGLVELLNVTSIKLNSDFKKIADSKLVFICVGTPSNNDGSISLAQIETAVEQISHVLRAKKEYYVICVKSTVPPGTTEKFVIPLLEQSGRKAGNHFGVCMSPEFLSEGKAIRDFMNPARIIIGEYDKRSGDTLANLYSGFSAPIIRTDPTTAEMIKLASNTFLATKISFINEIGNICKQLNIDVSNVSRGMGFDDRIGSKFLNAGIGFGGSCLPKDLNGLIAESRHIGYEPKLLQEVLNFNDAQALKAIELLKKHVSLENATIGILGLAFKPDTDDVRDSRAIKIVETLLWEGANIKAYDPLAVENFKTLFPQIEYVTADEVLDSNAILILTEWSEFSRLDYSDKIVIDGRRVPKAKEARIYEGVCW
jgi:UDPglucose 6-dehydrogenase